MVNYVAKRLIYTVFVLIGVTIVTFLLLKLAPGSPARLILGDDAPEQTVRAYEKELGLDKPIYVQYWKFFSGISRGDLGDSIYFKRSCWSLIKERMVATGQLALGGVCVILLISFPLGLIASVKRGTLADFFAMGFALLGQSISNVVLGMLMILIFGVQLGWLPVMGAGGIKNLIMPSIVMGVQMSALMTRLLRSNMTNVLKEDYITATYASGINRRTVIGKYALRNGILPCITLLGLEIAQLLGGAVVTEQIFAWPGIGLLTITAIQMRDFPLIQAILLITSAIFVIMILIVDIIYTLIDPRVDFN